MLEALNGKNGYLPITRARVLSSQMFNNMSIHYPHWSLLADMVSPNRFNESAHSNFSPLKKRTKIVKSEPSLAFRTFKAGLTNGATPKSRRWAQYTTANPAIKKNYRAQNYFSHITEVAENVLQLSNFYRVMPEINGDLGLFSNAGFLMLPDPKTGVYFYPLQMGTFAFQANAKGEITMFTRRLVMTVYDYVKEFGSLKPNGHIDWSNIPDYIKTMWDTAQYTNEVYLIQLIIENPFYIEGKPIFHSYQKRYQSYYWIDYLDASIPPQQSVGFRNEIVYGSGKDGFSEYASIRGYDYFPAIIPRWTAPAGYSVGIEGPGEVALNSMIVFQQMERDRLLAIEKILKPAMVAPSSLRRVGASTLPGGVTYIEDERMQTAQFKPAYQVDPKVAELILNNSELEVAFEEAFYKDIFMMFARQDIVSHVTASEVNERTAEKLSIINPMISQYDEDCTSKVLKNLLIIGETEGFIPPKPQELQGASTEVNYMSILANASKASMMGSVDRAIAFTSNMANVMQDPVLLKMFKGEEVVRGYSDYAGVDPRFLASPEEIIEVREAIAAQQQQQAMLAQAAQEAEIMKNVASAQMPANEQGSYLDTLSNASNI